MNLMWTGSDVLFLETYPPGTRFLFRVKIFFHRIAVRMIQPFLEVNYVVNERLKDKLEARGFRKMEVFDNKTRVLHATKYEKQQHEGFNVLYYIPVGKRNQKFIDWLYGWDRLQEYRIKNPKHNIVMVHGDSDMSKIYPIIDFYYRPTRHDGMSRIILECKIQEIPFDWTFDV